MGAIAFDADGTLTAPPAGAPTARRSASAAATRARASASGRIAARRRPRSARRPARPYSAGALLAGITQMLSGGNQNESALKATLDRLTNVAKDIQSQITTLMQLPDMEELRQWNEVLKQSVAIMNKTRSQLSASNEKTDSPTTQKVLDDARQSLTSVKQSLSVSKPNPQIDQVNIYNAIKQRDNQVRQYYEKARKAGGSHLPRSNFYSAQATKNENRVSLAYSV